MKEDGYVKLWRMSMDSRVFSNEGLWKVWTWCLMKASHTKRWASMNTGKGEIEIEIHPGQFIFGRHTAAKELKMSPSTIRNRINKLEKIKNLTIKPDNQYSIITILNWVTYQSSEIKEDNQKDKQRTTIGQAKDTDKNVKNVKKEKNIPDSIESGLFYLTKKKRKLSGKRLETFNEFWERFNYKFGKADAADSWYDIQELTISLSIKIYKAAENEARLREEKIANGQTPKWAQGWLTSRRWEDETNKTLPDDTDHHQPTAMELINA